MGIKEFRENVTNVNQYVIYDKGDEFILSVVAPFIDPLTVKANKQGDFINVSASLKEKPIIVGGGYSPSDLNLSIKVGNDVEVKSASVSNGLINISMAKQVNKSQDIDIQIPEPVKLHEVIRKPRQKRKEQTQE